MRKVFHIFFITIFCLLEYSAYSQDSIYARRIIERLSSSSFHGRGYLKNGDKKASAFIAGQFRRFKISKFNSGYYQDFPISVNTFPSKVELSIDGRMLVAGKDYLLDPASVSAKGNYPVLRIYSSELQNLDALKRKLLKHNKTIVWIDDRKDSLYTKQERKFKPVLLNLLAYLPAGSCPAVLISSTSKLSWTIDGFIQPVPIFTLGNISGLDSIRAAQFSFQNKFYPEYLTRNVLGFIRGTKKPDSIIMITAHYDHLGMMGRKTYFPGANDNASGIAMLLSLARYYSNPDHAPNYTIVFLCLSGEELGLLGSQYFVENPLFDLKSVKFLLNIDMAGNGDQGVTVVNGTIYRDKFDQLVKLNTDNHLLKQVKIRGEACNSDHCSFYRKAVPCFFIYTMGGVPFYHDVFDRAQTLPLSSFTNYFCLLSKFIQSI